jgi:hypothetical protein
MVIIWELEVDAGISMWLFGHYCAVSAVVAVFS